MDSLKGAEILIGREPQQGRLAVTLVTNGESGSAFLGQLHSVPSSVARCIPQENKAHCKISISQDGIMHLTNLKPENSTFANGIEVATKKITPTCAIALGPDMFPTNTDTILKAARKIAISMKQMKNRKISAPAQNVETKAGNEYSIVPLKQVWYKYHDDLFNLQKKQKNLSLIKSLYLPCTILSSIAGVAASHIGFSENISNMISYSLYAFAAIILFYGIVQSFTDKSLEEKEAITEAFQNNYVCPNPKCRHFIGNIPYNILKQDSGCPYCKCTYSSKK